MLRLIRLPLLAAAVLGALAAPARAAHNNACWYRNMERMDNVLNPPEGGDNDFFTRSGGPPNTYFVIANSHNTKRLPGFDVTTVPLTERGCKNSTFLNTRRKSGAFYDAATSYPDIDPGDPAGTGGSPSNSDKGFPNMIDGAKAYRYMDWTTGAANGQTVDAVCNGIYDVLLELANNMACKTCLTAKGYFLHPTSNADNMQAFHGNWLRFFPPAYIMIRRVFKQAVVSIQRIRLGTAYFAEVNSTDNPKGGVMQNKVNPPCNLLGDTSASWNSNRAGVLGQWDGNGSTPGFGDAGKVVYQPLGEMLLNLGANYGDYGMIETNDGDAGFITSGFEPGDNRTSAGDNNDSICVACQYSSVIVIGNGDIPNQLNDENIPTYIKDLDTIVPSAVPFFDIACTTDAECGGYLKCSDKRSRGSKHCEDNVYFDNVAQWLGSKDARDRYCGHSSSGGGLCDPEEQNVHTYTISVGKDSSLYRTAAEKSDGLYFRADDADELLAAIQNIVQFVLKNATSFSVAAITTVQTRGTTYAFIPRFRPSVQARWEGHLFRYKLFNEFASGCTLADTVAPFNADKLSRNPNGDADCDDVYLKDGLNFFVGENKDGEFMRLDTSVPYPWPVTTTPATPVWDGAGQLEARDLTADPRKIWTVIDSDNDGTFEPSEQIEFTTANVASLTPYLALGGVGGQICTDMANRLVKTYATEDECATDAIKFLRGRDLFDEDEDTNTDEPRPKVLGDIFHSSPVLVTPPAPRFLCDLGVSTQCTFSLYGSRLTPGGDTAYTNYAAKFDAIANPFGQGQRDMQVVVGANDGMIHSFHSGDIRFGDDPETPLVEAAGTPYYDLGTGREIWAFIPPDMLAKLKRIIQEKRHELFVDGTPMVRDIWVDSSTNPNQKDASEFKTLAIFAERQGGHALTAIDVTDPDNPQFRWTFPGGGTTFGLAMGETWNDFAPNSPPIVSVAVKDATGPITVNGVRAREVYATFLNGGYDGNGVRGRGVFVVDAYTGAQLWRFARIDSTATTDPRDKIWPVASTISVLDLGPGSTSLGAQDGLFDTAVVGDTGGQVWTFRLFDPGEDTNGDGIFDNWFGARAFVQYKGDVIRKRSPFFQLPSATVLLDSGNVRAYLGAGDRMNIRDPAGGDCGLTNLRACVRKDCTVDSKVDPDDNGTQFVHGRWKYTTASTTLTTNAFSIDSVNPESSCTTTLNAEDTVAVTCGSDPTVTYDWKVVCDWDAGDGDPECETEVVKPLQTKIARTFTTQNSRFYAIKLFDAASRKPFTTYTESQTYDTAALTETDLVNADTTVSSTSGNGYYVSYPAQDESTASGTGILSGCVIWNSLIPDPAAGACGLVVGDTAKLYRAHYISGATSCGSIASSVRSESRKSIVPPPTQTAVVSVNPNTGEVRYSMVSLEPGQSPAQTSVGQSDLLGTIHWLEVPRQLHRCRHVGGVGCQ